MKFGFVEPREKKIISNELMLILYFFGAVFFFVVAIFIFLHIKIFTFNSNIESKQNIIASLNQEILKHEQEIKNIDEQRDFAQKRFDNNQYLNRTIQNIFELVPDKITLSKAELKNQKLILYGETPTKDIYNLLLLAPLRSIFDDTYTSFYQLRNGWYRFVSINTMDENMTVFRNR
jgi:hypothetical protein